MKKFPIVFVLFTASVVSNAQLFIGGSVSMSASAGNTENNGTTVDEPSNFTSAINPVAGFILSDRFWAGLALGWSIDHYNSRGNPEFISNATQFQIAPFVRYYAILLNRFSVYGEAKSGVSIGSEHTKTDGNTEEGPKTTLLFLNITPGMAYDLSDRVQLNAYLNLFNIGLSHKIEKDNDIIERNSSVSFSAGLSNLVTTGAISIGAIIRL